MCIQNLKFVTFAGLLLWHASCLEQAEERALLADDECAEAPGERCDLSALQKKGLRLDGLDVREEAADAVEADCHDAVEGERCFKDIRWAKHHGVKEHPNWYPHMTGASSNRDFQWVIHVAKPSICPKPCGGKPPPRKEPKPLPRHPMPEVPVDPTACLCVFDIDRTLTSKQGTADGVCPLSQSVPGVEDNAYGGGMLTLSEFAKDLAKSACAECYLGLCSHGNANFEFSKERAVLLKQVMQSEVMKELVLKPENVAWSDEPHLSPYVVYSPDGEKQLHVAKIIEWYARQGIGIAKENTFFYDDREDNVLPFEGTGMNARQISCSSRDMDIGNGAVGLCGATVEEVVREKGVAACPAPPEPVEEDPPEIGSEEVDTEMDTKDPPEIGSKEADAETDTKDMPEIDGEEVDAEEDREASEAEELEAMQYEASESPSSELGYAGPE